MTYELDPLATKLFRHLLKLRLPVGIDIEPSPFFAKESTEVKLFTANRIDKWSVKIYFAKGKHIGSYLFIQYSYYPLDEIKPTSDFKKLTKDILRVINRR